MERVVKKIITPIEKFMHLEASSGIVLVACTLVAMVAANSVWGEAYHHLVHLDVGFKLGAFEIQKSLLHWINDGLMVIFFFFVGMEIKKELLHGALSSPKKAALPIFAALGGMVVPALVYHGFNPEGPAVSGWGIPMATDIAFAVGILALLGKRVPLELKVFLLALAIVDDLGAVLVIAVFYTSSISAKALGVAALALGFMYLMRKAGIRKKYLYVAIGAIVWFAVLKSGVHATVAGVLIGFLTPAFAIYPKKELEKETLGVSESLVAALKRDPKGDHSFSDESKHYLGQLHKLTVEADSPLNRLVDILHPWVGFLIMPVFALANAGVHVEAASLGDLVDKIFSNSIANGVSYGLLFGKPIGIFLFCFLSVKLKMADLPKGVNWGQIVGLGFLGGIGFTMALFVSSLAIKDPGLEVFSKLGILKGSFFAAIVGIIVLLIFSKKPNPQS